jgi:hypothetical protein
MPYSRKVASPATSAGMPAPTKARRMVSIISSSLAPIALALAAKDPLLPTFNAAFDFLWGVVLIMSAVYSVRLFLLKRVRLQEPVGLLASRPYWQHFSATCR